LSAVISRETPMEKAGRRHRLAHEARDQAIVTATAADRAELDFLALLVGDVEQEFSFEDRAGVIFEAADDGGVDQNAIRLITACYDSLSDVSEFGETILEKSGLVRRAFQKVGDFFAHSRSSRNRDKSNNRFNLPCPELSSWREVALAFLTAVPAARRAAA
jgi:hypothetical protein